MNLLNFINQVIKDNPSVTVRNSLKVITTLLVQYMTINQLNDQLYTKKILTLSEGFKTPENGYRSLIQNIFHGIHRTMTLNISFSLDNVLLNSGLTRTVNDEKLRMMTNFIKSSLTDQIHLSRLEKDVKSLKRGYKMLNEQLSIKKQAHQNSKLASYYLCKGIISDLLLKGLEPEDLYRFVIYGTTGNIVIDAIKHDSTWIRLRYDLDQRLIVDLADYLPIVYVNSVNFYLNEIETELKVVKKANGDKIIMMAA